MNRTELEARLREAMTPPSTGTDRAFVASTVSRAVRARRRRRAWYAVAAPVTAAAVAAGVVLGVQDRTITAPDPEVQQPEPTLTPIPDGKVPLKSWLENRTLEPSFSDRTAPAAAGTLLYRRCPECSIVLVSPSGRRIDLADVHPHLSAELARQGLAGVSISPTGHWLGRPVGDGYRIHDLEHPSVVVDVPSPAEGNRWEMVGWSEQSWAPMLARYDGDRIEQLLTWNTLDTGKPLITQVPAGITVTPELGRRSMYLVPVMAPAQAVDGQMPRVASTVPRSHEHLVVSRMGMPGAAPGEVVGTAGWDSSYVGDTFEECIGTDETLVDSSGRVHVWEVRGSRPAHADTLTITHLVFSRDVSVTQPVALLVNGCTARDLSTYPPPFVRGLPAGGRIELPASSRDASWSFLGMLPDGEVALLRDTGDELTYVRMDAEGALHRMHELPPGAEVITPGGKIP